jgi:hypothetical protein
MRERKQGAVNGYRAGKYVQSMELECGRTNGREKWLKYSRTLIDC